MTSKKLELKFTVDNESEAAELSAAWREIVAGTRVRLNTAATDVDDIIERAMPALQRIAKAIESNPGTGQAGRLIRFLAGCYNGEDYHFDLTDLRVLDAELANACIDYLNYDRLGKAEVHKHLPGGGRQIEGWFDRIGLVPRPRLDQEASQGRRLWALAERLDRNPNDLLRRAVEDLLSVDEHRAFIALKPTRTLADEESPLTHAAKAGSATRPLCGSLEGPWISSGFRFEALDCYECRSIILSPTRRHDD